MQMSRAIALTAIFDCPCKLLELSGRLAELVSQRAGKLGGVRLPWEEQGVELFVNIAGRRGTENARHPKPSYQRLHPPQCDGCQGVPHSIVIFSRNARVFILLYYFLF